MNLDSLSFALSQISYTVANLTKKNYKASLAETPQLVSLHGAEADRHLLRCLFSFVDFSGDGRSSGKDFHQTQYLISEVAWLINKPSFISSLCYAVDHPLQHQKSIKPSSQLFPQLSKVLKLSRVQEVAIGIGLLYSSNSDTQQFASQFLKSKFPDLLRSYTDADTVQYQGPAEGGLQDVATEVLHLIIFHLLHDQNKKNPALLGVSDELKESFLRTLRKDFPRDRVPAVVA